MKYLIIIFLGLIPILLIIGLGLLYHFAQYEILIAALIALVYPIGLWVGYVSFQPPQ